MTHDSLIRFDAVGFGTSDATILDRIDLALAPGDVVGVTGPNGAGKTTLLRLCATLLTPTRGTWTVLGAVSESPADAVTAARRDISMIGHLPAVWPELTLQENVDIVDSLNPGADEGDPLGLVGLGAARHRRADRASLGMQRRVEFARLFRRLPRLLLLDEAHAGLDAAASSIVDEIVARVASAGGATVMVSHDAGRMQPLLTRAYRLDHGALVDA